MSETKAPERDETGRFVKTDEAPVPLSADEMHPVSKILFGWVSAKATPSIFLWGTILISVALVLIDYGMNRHDYMDFANFNGFYAFWGFGAFAIAVLSGWPLGKLLRRGEDYYGEGDATPKDAAGQGEGE
ncbi:MAG: hypothetical protein AAFQ22_04730 [Pseudomonadota bacterium]